MSCRPNQLLLTAHSVQGQGSDDSADSSPQCTQLSGTVPSPLDRLTVDARVNGHYNGHMITLTATEAKRRFLELLRTAQQRGEEVIITHRGEPKAVILSHDEYERLLETLEILSDRELLKKIRRGIAEASAGQTVSLDEAIE